MSAKETLHKFLDSVTDLTSLEVTTYTGKLSQVIDAGTGKLQWDAFRPDGALVLVAATLIRGRDVERYDSSARRIAIRVEP